jgi:hypothetical protein
MKTKTKLNLIASLSVCAAMFGVLAGAAPAFAEGVPSSFPYTGGGDPNDTSSGAIIRSMPYNGYDGNGDVVRSATNVYYAYVKSGETLDVAAVLKRLTIRSGSPVDNSKSTFTVNIYSPTGVKTTWTSAEIPATANTQAKWRAEVLANPAPYSYSVSGLSSATAGVWKVEFLTADPTQTSYAQQLTEDVTVKNSNDTALTGRVWQTAINLSQNGAPEDTADYPNMTIYAINNAGDEYKIDYFGYIGGDSSTLTADAVGNAAADGSCISAYESQGSNAVTTADPPYHVAGANCEKYRLFFALPASDLPVSATSMDGEMLIRPNILSANQIIKNFNFTPTNAKSPDQSGEFLISLDVKFSGNFNLLIDTNNNGRFDDAVDRTIPVSAAGDDTNGNIAVAFDGKDGTGATIPAERAIVAKIDISKSAEVHTVMEDIEGLVGGLQLTLMNGANAGVQRLYWNDTELQQGAPVVNQTPVLDGRAGVDSTGGVHGGWIAAIDSWGDNRRIDNWAFQNISVARTVNVPARDLATGEVVKPETPDAPTTPSTGFDRMLDFASANSLNIAGVVFVAMLLLAVKKKFAR